MKNKLILICSDEIEGTTDEVCKWLNHFNKKYIRISKNNVIEITSINISKTNSEIFFKIDDTELKLSDISSYWYRRSYLNFKKIPLTYFEFDNENITNEISQFLLSEQEKIYDFFHNKLNKKSKLNTFQDNYINKIKVLDEARKLKIQIPKTLITDDLLKLISFDSRIITKAISDFVIEKSGKNFFSFTEEIFYDKIDFSQPISNSLFQELIEKEFEIRTFYFNNNFYSSAIFSQLSTKTKLDFRNYDKLNPNRVVPYKLPTNLENKLRKLMAILNLNSGSFDFAVDKFGNHILFEINPVGQFEQVLIPCNYSLTKDIAMFL